MGLAPAERLSVNHEPKSPGARTALSASSAPSALDRADKAVRAPSGTASRVKNWPALTLLALVLWLQTAVQADAPSTTTTNSPATVIVVVGASGEPEYGENFAKWAKLWDQGCHEAGARQITVGLATNETQVTDYDFLKETLTKEPKESNDELWLVLIGHGTYDGKEARYNLRGPDLSGTDLAAWLQPFRRPVALINCTSSSGPFITKLSMAGRVVITATKSGYEQNYARFGQYISEAIVDAGADLDKDGQTSLLEAYLTAAYRVADFYKTEGRLATEHALLDDNGDGRGTPADWFRGVRAVKKAAEGASLDGLRAHQFHLVRSRQERELSPAVRSKRDQLELAIAKLRDSKAQLPEDEYYQRLELLLLDLASLYHQASDKSP
jgi:hypothetical protein